MVKKTTWMWVLSAALILGPGAFFSGAAPAAGNDIKGTGAPASGAGETAAKKAVALDAVVVTADKRERDLQEVAASVSVVGETQAADFGLERTLDLVTMTPNLYITDTGNAMMTTFASIRGITGGMTGIPSLGFYVDDVYYPGLDVSLFDVERIEVLRGPQGTLYGRNSEAGIINVITKKPSDTWEGSLTLDAAEYNSFGARGAVSGPVVPGRLAFKAALRYYETDGYFKNRFDGSDEAGAVENTDARFSFRFTPSDRLNLTLGYDFQNYDSPEYANFAPLDQGRLRKNITADYPGESAKDANGGYLRAGLQLQGMKLVSITSARNEDNYITNDIDFTPVDMMTLTLDKETTGFSQELRLVSDRKGAALQWLCGVFLLSEKEEGKYDTWMNFMNMGMGMPGETLTQESRTDTRGGAVFGEMTYAFENRVNVTLGLRYDYEKKEFDYTQAPDGPALAMMGYGAKAGEADASFDAWLPKVSVSYRASEQVMPYATISRGFRSGGFDDKEQIGSSYEPEFTWNYELGAKTAWLDNRLQVNAALFFIDWSDMQVEVMTQDGTSVHIDNAGQATSRGAELELLARPMPGLELMAGAAYTRAEYDDYAQGANVYDGNRIIDSPEYTFNFGATYRFDNGVFVNAKYAHFGKIHYDPANTRFQGDYGLADAKVGYETEHFDIYVYGKNLFDEEYATRAFEVNNAWYGRAGAPRKVGIMFTARF